MSPLVLLCVLGLGVALVCFLDSRKGFTICLLAGFVQDPLRKLLPGEPVVLSVLAGLFTVITVLGMCLRPEGRRTFRQALAVGRPLVMAMKLFLGFVLLQSMVSFARTGSPFVAGIGLLSYLAPVPAFLLAYAIVRKVPGSIYRFLMCYIALCAVMLSGVYLSFFDLRWDILRPVGPGVILYAGGGEYLLPPGFFRAAEVAAWHGAAAACMLVILASATNRGTLRRVAVVLLPFLLLAVVLTGRRKMLVEILLFVPAFYLLLIRLRGGGSRLTTTLVAAALGAVFLVTQLGYLRDKQQKTLDPLLQRTARLIEESRGRLGAMSIENFGYIIARNGFFGSGAGTGSQGAQYFGGGTTLVGFAAEGGLGKVLAELGVPGVLLLMWVGVQLALYIWRALKRLQPTDTERVVIGGGAMAFLGVNAVVFTTAHQVYGDVFVLLILGWFTGFLIAVLQGADITIRRKAMVLTPALKGYLLARRAAARGQAFPGEKEPWASP